MESNALMPIMMMMMMRVNVWLSEMNGKIAPAESGNGLIMQCDNDNNDTMVSVDVSQETSNKRAMHVDGGWMGEFSMTVTFEET
jgi:hypothetical protein